MTTDTAAGALVGARRRLSSPGKVIGVALVISNNQARAATKKCPLVVIYGTKSVLNGASVRINRQNTSAVAEKRITFRDGCSCSTGGRYRAKKFRLPTGEHIVKRVPCLHVASGVDEPLSCR